MRFYLCLVICLSIPGWLLANEPDKTIELTIYSGYSFAADTLEVTGPCILGCPRLVGFKNTVDDSILLGFNVGYYFTRNIELEGNLAIAPNHRFRSIPTSSAFFVEDNIVTYNYDVNFVYNIDWKGIRPFFRAGIGGVTRDSDSLMNDFAFNFGVGSKFYYKDIGFRLGVNDHVIPDYFNLAKKKHDIQIQSGILFMLD